jgi:hypothetical protein
MIHYINGVPAKNIRLQKPKRHAVAHYRHTKRMANIKDFATRALIVSIVAGILTATALYSL